MPDRLRTVPAKKHVLLEYLEHGITMLHLDARRPGVVVPRQYEQDPHLRLNLSYRYQIPDLEIDDERVQATLSFGGRSFRCVVPWEAVFGITSQATGDGQVWPEDLPAEVMKEAEKERPRLAAVESEDETRPDSAPKPKGPPHLRLVR